MASLKKKEAIPKSREKAKERVVISKNTKVNNLRVKLYMFSNLKARYILKGD